MRCPHHKKKLNDQMINQLNNKEKLHHVICLQFILSHFRHKSMYIVMPYCLAPSTIFTM